MRTQNQKKGVNRQISVAVRTSDFAQFDSVQRILLLCTEL